MSWLQIIYAIPMAVFGVFAIGLGLFGTLSSLLATCIWLHGGARDFKEHFSGIGLLFCAATLSGIISTTLFIISINFKILPHIGG